MTPYDWLEYRYQLIQFLGQEYGQMFKRKKIAMINEIRYAERMFDQSMTCYLQHIEYQLNDSLTTEKQ